MSEADWDLLESTRASWRKPRRELVATDGQKLTLGETTLTLYITPGPHPGHDLDDHSRADGGTPHIGGVLGRHGVQLGGESHGLHHA